jgi:hypothetical protein
MAGSIAGQFKVHAGLPGCQGLGLPWAALSAPWQHALQARANHQSAPGAGGRQEELSLPGHSESTRLGGACLRAGLPSSSAGPRRFCLSGGWSEGDPESRMLTRIPLAGPTQPVGFGALEQSPSKTRH